MRTNYSTKKVIFVATLAAISVVFGLFEIPLGLPWLKLDVSEIAILVAAIVVGYKGAFSLILIRGILRQGLQGDLFIPHEMIGELIAVMASLIILGSYYVITKWIKTYKAPLLLESVVDPKPVSKKEFLSVVVGVTATLTVLLIILNIFILTPIYLSAFDALMGFFGFQQFHFTIFTLVKDPGMKNIFGIDLSSWKLYVTYILTNYGLLNLSKGLLTTMLFLPIKSRLEKVEL